MPAELFLADVKASVHTFQISAALPNSALICHQLGLSIHLLTIEPKINGETTPHAVPRVLNFVLRSSELLKSESDGDIILGIVICIYFAAILWYILTQDLVSLDLSFGIEYHSQCHQKGMQISNCEVRSRLFPRWGSRSRVDKKNQNEKNAAGSFLSALLFDPVPPSAFLSFLRLIRFVHYRGIYVGPTSPKRKKNPGV
jgi:hypothetical protein